MIHGLSRLVNLPEDRTIEKMTRVAEEVKMKLGRVVAAVLAGPVFYI